MCFCVLDDALTRRRRIANTILASVGGLYELNMILYLLLEKLNNVDRKSFSNEFKLEHELRLTLNILCNFMIYNNEDPSVAREFTNS